MADPLAPPAPEAPLAAEQPAAPAGAPAAAEPTEYSGAAVPTGVDQFEAIKAAMAKDAPPPDKPKK